MKRMLLLVVAVAIITTPAWAFHDGGVAHCNGCHTMHNSQGNLPMNDPDGSGGPQLDQGHGYTDLLLYSSASDTCLSCHGGARSYNVFADVADIDNPNLSDYYSAGNFVFLLEDNINDGHSGSTRPIPGQASGHNIKSGIKGSDWDLLLTRPPSQDGTGQLSNNNIHCSSCHDPHGTDSFRLLYREGQTVTVGGDTITYGGNVIATGISFGGVETDENHNAYVSGYSEWCNTCHTGFHDSYGDLIHPSGTTLDAEQVTAYNRYRGTTDCVNKDGWPMGEIGGSPCGDGTQADAYLADVPFEDLGATTTSTVGPTQSSVVACMSCHRAHATSAPDAGRWDFSVTLLDEDGLESLSWPIPRSANGTYSDGNQRSLCNKCHSQDEYDHITP